jgi:hypothetical protein
MKRLLSLVLSTAIAATACIIGLSGCHSEDTFEGFPIVQIRLNGNIVETDVPAIDIKGNTMIPLNIVSESLGASIDIDSDAKIVSIDLRNIETVQYELEQARQRIAKLANAMRSENMLPAPSNPVKLDRPYVLLSAGIGPDCPFVSKFGRGGLIGSGMNYIYNSIGQYSGSVLARDSILVFSLDHEVSFDILKDWPESLADVLPFTCEELSMYKPPFVWFKLDKSGRQRGIAVVGGGSEDIGRDISGLADLVASGWVSIDCPTAPRITTAAAMPDMLDGSAGEATVVSNERFKIITHKSCTADGPKMLEWADEAIARLEPVFPDAFETVGMATILVTIPSGNLQHGTAYAHPRSEPPQITFTAPSLAFEENSYFDEDYYLGNLGHEFMHCVYERYSLAATGQYLSDRGIPQWFCEGVGEYARLIILGESRFDAKQASQYNPSVQKIIASGLSSVDVYSGGAWALRYMNHQYGPEKIVALMKSKEFSFADAMKSELGVTLTEFEYGLKEWLKNR